MLKALELVGFKSFADKTRFDFPAGITVIVGPNGSGKSNVVDAIKWVLGEQSAKSLRGKEMSDVIFKGAGAGRKPLNTAEATIIFDNSDQRLPIDEAEVHVTRRVYRSGEGEYLINRRPCRLKDIRDLFRGTGVGVDAYSLIEQGKVDRLLQASAQDRRAIFEEAAGISRFKAKKIEAQRRLARVDQNLMRLSDIVDEVESRLKSVRSQASKAQRYREYSDRLQELRTHVGWSDWRSLTGRLESFEAELAEKQDRRGELQRQWSLLQGEITRQEEQAESLNAAARSLEAEAAECAQTIVRAKSEIRHQQHRVQEFDGETARRRSRLLALTGKAGNATLLVAEVRQQAELARGEHQAARQHQLQAEEEVRQSEEQTEALRQQSDQRRQAYMEQMRLAAETGNRVQTLEEALQAADARLRQLQAQHQAVQDQASECDAQQADLQTEIAAAASELARLQGETAAAQEELERSTSEKQRQENALARLTGRLDGLRERAEHLGEITRQLHGVHSGAKHLLERARSDAPGPCRQVRGLAAELLDAPLDVANLIDVALGAAAQCLVVDSSDLIAALQRGELEPPGPVSLLCLEEVPDRHCGKLDLSGRDGVEARLSDLVHCRDDDRRLAHWLLGDAWLVRDLELARRLWRMAPGEARFVTRDAAVLQRNGAVEFGSPHAAAGLVSRRSELKAVEASWNELSGQAATLSRRCETLAEDVAHSQLRLAQLQQQQRHAEQQASDLRSRRATLLDQRRRLDVQQGELTEALEQGQQHHQALTDQWQAASQRLNELENVLAEIDGQLQHDQTQLELREAERQQRTDRATSARVELARSEQRLEGLLGQLQRLEEDTRERQRSIEEARSQLRELQHRRAAAELEMLRRSDEMNDGHWRRQLLEQRIAALLRERGETLEQRNRVSRDAERLGRTIHGLEQAEHQLELEASQVRHQRDSLVERLRDEYGVEIGPQGPPPRQFPKLAQTDPPAASADPPPAASEEDAAEAERMRQQIDEEIADLRRKIHRIGPVNIDALEELEAIEERYQGLASQYQDLKQAKETLERIIHRINGDSRRLFTETMEAIRTNFRTLFRQAFGGGQADLVLEEGVDVLEAGVEIVATPPGKPSFNNSLLSGGEKALTAVALLLAIFQFRPSPFCILDEVDAPFDEANISRFLDVLREFLGWTKFVVVTHSKKTMTAAHTLYGVTMQESGVSKKVSVRFEDVREDGHFESSGEQQPEVA